MNARGQGCFVLRADGSYLYRKSAGNKADGKRKILSVVAKTKSACIQRMKEKEAAWYREQKRMEIGLTNTVEELCTRHLEFQMKTSKSKVHFYLMVRLLTKRKLHKTFY